MLAYNAAAAFAYATKDYINAHGHIPGYFTDEFLALCKDYATDRRYRPMALAGCGNCYRETTVFEYGHNKLIAHYDNKGNVEVRDYYTDSVLISL